MIEGYIKKLRLKCDFSLKQMLPGGRDKVSSAARYAVFSGGKRFRPVLFLAVFESLGGKINGNIVRIACSLELIHTFSLIQDDLPLMDNDDYRRGRLTVHKVFGEDTAVLASDYLLNEAYASVLENSSLGAQLKVRVLFALARSVEWLIGGQEKDMRLVNRKKVAPAELDDIYSAKTGALIAACVETAAMLRGLGSRRLKRLNSFAAKIGLAYQISDDILNLAGDKKNFKGRIASDSKRGKPAYPSVCGIGRSREVLADLIKEAKSDLEKMDLQREKLSGLCDFILKRGY